MKKYSFVKTSVICALILSIFAVAVYAVVLSKSPTACSGKWNVCINAFADNLNRASAGATNKVNTSGIWRNYGFNIPSSAQINSVIVRADFFATNSRGFAKIAVSGDNGATYGPIHIIGGNTVERTYIINVTNDLAWTPSKLNNANFRVSVTCFKSTSSGSNPTCSLDWIPVNVTYTNDSQPVATASAVPTSGLVPLTVNFTGTVTGGDLPLTFFWNFKDGTNSTLQNPQHTFSTAGAYNVSFAATDNDGDMSTSNILITATNPPFDFQVSAIPSSGTVTAGNNATSTVLVDLLSGNTETVYLVANNCPANATCSFAPFIGLPSFNSTFTVATGSNQFNSTPTGVYNISIRGIAFGAGIERMTNYILTVN